MGQDNPGMRNRAADGVQTTWRRWHRERSGRERLRREPLTHLLAERMDIGRGPFRRTDPFRAYPAVWKLRRRRCTG